MEQYVLKNSILFKQAHRLIIQIMFDMYLKDSDISTYNMEQFLMILAYNLFIQRQILNFILYIYIKFYLIIQSNFISFYTSMVSM